MISKDWTEKEQVNNFTRSHTIMRLEVRIWGDVEKQEY